MRYVFARPYRGRTTPRSIFMLFDVSQCHNIVGGMCSYRVVVKPFPSSGYISLLGPYCVVIFHMITHSFGHHRLMLYSSVLLLISGPMLRKHQE